MGLLLKIPILVTDVSLFCIMLILSGLLATGTSDYKIISVAPALSIWLRVLPGPLTVFDQKGYQRYARNFLHYGRHL